MADVVTADPRIVADKIVIVVVVVVVVLLFACISSEPGFSPDN